MTTAIGAPRTITLILLAALAVLPLNFILPSMPALAREFDVDYGVIGLALAGYAGVSACLQLVLGPLSDRFGRRPVILVALAVFLVATLGAATAQDATSFLAFRMVQAVIAPVYAVSLASIRDVHTREAAASKIGYIATAWGVSPLIGPTISGVIDQFFGWRFGFALLAVLAVLVLMLCWTDFRETNTKRSSSVLSQMRAYPELLSSQKFWAYALCMTFSMGGFYAFLAGAPLAAQALYNVSPATLGILLGTITLGFMTGSFFAGRLSGKLKLSRLLLLGRLLAIGGLVGGLLVVWAGADHVLMLFVPCMFVGFANGLTQPSANAGAISVKPQLIGSAAGLASAISVGGAGVISGLVGLVITADNARYSLLLIMLGTALAALVAALLAIRAEGKTA
jgi:DHA1 family bicyclomycin/chloramphenicol resistance-like MFS transporter